MGLFDIFRKKKVELTEEQLKWNKMWETWAEEKAASPYAELMTYQSEINNGGHSQYFSNLENTDDLLKSLDALKAVLSEKLGNNLQRAYEAYLSSEEKEDDQKAEEILEKCDDVFYENEEEINRVLEGYAAEIEL